MTSRFPAPRSPMFLVAALSAALLTGPGVASAAASGNPESGRVTSPAALAALVARATRAGVPGYSRQTGLACGVCHYGFPQLTPFGRLFKLNGYTMTGLKPIVSRTDSAARASLSLSPIGPVSVMALASATRIAKALPGTIGTTAQFPQQMSVFLASGITDKLGIFTQFTYEDQAGTFGIDNTDLRFATHTTLATHDLIVGLTLNNNPTVQDVWNSTPAWSYPFVSAAVAPTPAAGTLLEGALGQSVVGLGAYSLFNNWLYTELSGYASAPQTVPLPLDSGATNIMRSVSPYWRVAVQHDFSSDYLMVGTFGMRAQMYPVGVTGPANTYTDFGFDAQLEHRLSSGMLIGRASYIHENQDLPASVAASPPVSQNLSNALNSYKINLSYLPSPTHTLTVGLFGVSGRADTLRYASSGVTGSSTSSPASRGASIELVVYPWLNVSLGAQYVMYQRFNGGSRNYDVPVNGRSASDNNTLYLYLWLAY